MRCEYSLNGDITLMRNNGEVVELSLIEAMEIVEAVTDIKPMPFDRDEICQQIADAVGLEIAAWNM